MLVDELHNTVKRKIKKKKAKTNTYKIINVSSLKISL